MSFPLPENHVDKPFYEAILVGIGAPITNNNLASLYAWRQSEGGSAAYNPFNTTYNMPGATLYANSTHGVKSYSSPQEGLEATVKTLLLGYYDDVVNVLQNSGTPEQFARAVGNSPWGTNYGLFSDVVAMFRRGRIVFTPLATKSTAPPIASLSKYVEETNTTTATTKNYWWLFPIGVLALGTLGTVLLIGQKK